MVSKKVEKAKRAFRDAGIAYASALGRFPSRGYGAHPTIGINSYDEDETHLTLRLQALGKDGKPVDD